MTVRGPRRATRADGSTPLGSPSGSPRGELPSATTPTVRSYTHQLSQQVDRTTGSAHDTIDGGLGIDTISGSAGDDQLVGASNDGSQDTLNGGDGTDTCQGPAPDPDIHMSCENTTMPPTSGPGSGTDNASQLCEASGGVFSLTLLPVGYICVFNPLNAPASVNEARTICTGRGGTFVNLMPASYSCVLPATTQAVRLAG
jgi:hypothetical protein